MPAVPRQVDGSLLCPEQQRVGEVLSGAPSRGIKHVLQGGGLAGHEARDRRALEQPQLPQRLHGLTKVIRRGLLVHAIGRLDVGHGEKVRDALVGEDHGLLDEPRRTGATADAHTRRLPVGIEYDLGLHRLEVDGAAVMAHPLAQSAYLVEHAERLRHGGVGVIPAGERVGVGGALEHRVHLVICETCRRSYRRGHHLRGDEPPVGREDHPHAHGQAVLPWLQRADVIAQPFGQHGEHSVDEVYGTGTLLRLVVDGSVPAHVVRHVSDVHPEFEPTVIQSRRAHGIVEVTRVRGIDGHGEKVAQVAAGRVGGERPSRVGHDRLRLIECRRGELRRQPERGDDRLDVDVKLFRGAETPFDGDHGGAVPRGIRGNSRHHDVALGHAERLGGVVFGDDEEVVAEASVERGHDPERTRGAIAPSEGRDGPLEHELHVGELAYAVRVDERHLDLVSVHPLAHSVAGELEATLGRLHRSHARTRDAQRPREHLALSEWCLGGAAATAALMWSFACHVCLTRVMTVWMGLPTLYPHRAPIRRVRRRRKAGGVASATPPAVTH